MGKLEYEFPSEIDTENAKAWYLRTFYGLSWEEIGKALYLPSARECLKRQTEFYREERDDQGGMELDANWQVPKPFIAGEGYDLDFEFVWDKPPVCALCGRRIKPGEGIRWRQRVIGERIKKCKQKVKVVKVVVQDLVHAIRVYDGKGVRCLGGSFDSVESAEDWRLRKEA
ncbi:MAG: hypothetical protein HPY71_01495 [Firmicutes bacterium]|nr:hypothetical protein [Bacillota bacterium]